MSVVDSEPVQLKVCGLTRGEDYVACVELGVDAVGLNFWPGSRRCIAPREAQDMLALRPRAATRVVGVFVDAPASRVAELATSLRLDAVQLHGDVDLQYYVSYFAERELAWVRVLRGTPELSALSEPLAQLASRPAWTILDAHVAGYGGAGAKTDWVWAAEAVKRLAPAPVWLAGGLKPENAAEAVARVGPAGLDVASGVEISGATRGQKDHDAIAAMLRICQKVPRESES